MDLRGTGVNIANQREKAEASGGRTAGLRGRCLRTTNGQQVLLSVKIGDMQQTITELKRTKWHGIVRYEQER